LICTGANSRSYYLGPVGSSDPQVSSRLNLRGSLSKRLCPHLLSGKTLLRTGLYLQSQAGELGTGGSSQIRAN
jgi:hypothetical protein